jgi:hypothetical protein
MRGEGGGGEGVAHKGGLLYPESYLRKKKSRLHHVHLLFLRILISEKKQGVGVASSVTCTPHTRRYD